MFPTAPPDYDWYNPIIRFVRIAQTNISLQGPFVDGLNSLLDKNEALKQFALRSGKDHILMPVHELQVTKITSTFPDVEVLPPEASFRALAQTSIR